jgi:purine-binding chemotaxis protein CheW
MLQKQQFCTFFVGGLFYGVEVEKVQEILRYQEMTPVPLAPAVVRGLINLRGQIVTAIDLRRRLGQSEHLEGQQLVNVVLHTDDCAVSLLVDEIGDVVEVREDSFEPPPETLSQKSRTFIRGVHKLHGRLMHVLDVEQAINLVA